MHHYKKAIVALDGHSAKIENKTSIIQNLRYAMASLHIPMEIYESHQDGFIKLKEDMNQDGVLYIINDSLPYHLCEKPNILITRSPLWVQAMPKPNTIGIFTHEAAGTFPSEIISCISRNQPVRQPHNHAAAKTYFVVNEYTPKDTNSLGRNGFASFTWSTLLINDIHSEFVLHTSDSWPMVNQMLKDGIELFDHPDDILVIMNRDICLIPEATALLRNYMDTHNITECFAQRIDVNTAGVLRFKDLEGKLHYPGIDLFAFRKDSEVMKGLVDIDFKLGRMAYDSFWAHRIKNKIPYNICYHLPHDSEWQSNESAKSGNAFNMLQIEKHSTSSDLSPELYGEYFEALI
jgi:hypothetical protein